MPAAIPFEQDILQLIFQAVPITSIAQNHATTPATQYFVSLLRSDPAASVAPDQLTSEITYTGYTRVAVARTAAGWNVTGGVVTPINVLQFGAASAVASQILATHFGVGTLISGAGKLLAAGKLVPPIAIVTGTAPRIDNNPPASRFPEDWM